MMKMSPEPVDNNDKVAKGQKDVIINDRNDLGVDEVMQEAGIFGRHQLKTLLVLFVPVVLCSLMMFNFIFSAPMTHYRCRIPGCDDRENPEYRTKMFEGLLVLNKYRNDGCLMYAIRHNVTLPKDRNATCVKELFDTDRTVKCVDFIFEEKNTLVEELDIPCYEWKRTMIGTAHSLGAFFALPVVGYFSDRYGRLPTLAVSCLFTSMTGTVRALSVNYPMFLSLHFVEGLLGSGVFSAAYMLGLESLVSSMRTVGASCINVVFSFGKCVMATIAWKVPYWRTFLLSIYLPSFLLVFVYFLIKESPLWLFSKKRYDEFLDDMKEVAKVNRKTISEETIAKFEKQYLKASKVENEERHQTGKYRDLLTSRVLMCRLMKCSFWWISVSLCSYGLTINAVTLAGNKYMNYFLTGIVDVPAHIMGFFCHTYAGRKKSILLGMVLSGACFFGFSFIPKEYDMWVRLPLYFLGKFFQTLAVGSVYLYTSELFPTSMRHSIFSFCTMSGKIGSILAPQLPLLMVYMESLPTLIFGSLCVLSTVLLLNSPETLNTKLPETIEEAENL